MKYNVYMNENPALTLAAIQSPHDARDFLFTDVAAGAAPFDWNTGYDAEEELATILGVPTKLPIKNQNGSGSCGGQAESYGGEIISALHDKVFEEKSAKFAYAPVAAPGGGSTGRDLANRSIKAGWGSEALTPSYDNGQPPTEAFMERVSDITPEAIAHAAKDRALNYNLLPVDIDFIAQAIRDFKFVRIGVVGSNNGTWLTAEPKPPVDGESYWYHWIGGLKAKMRGGKKAIGFPNSWGVTCGNYVGCVIGENGWQWLTEDYFKSTMSNNPYGYKIPLFEPRCYTWNAVPIDPTWHHTFTKELERGMVDPECINLQTALRMDGEFPNGVPYNQNFGPVTEMAVQKFQVKYGIVGVGGPGYGRCGPKTIAELNKLFAGA